MGLGYLEINLIIIQYGLEGRCCTIGFSLDGSVPSGMAFIYNT